MNVESETHVTLRAQRIEVNQSLNYQIRYEPLDRLSLDVPRTLLEVQKLRFTVAGEPAEAREAGEPPAADSSQRSIAAETDDRSRPRRGPLSAS